MNDRFLIFAATTSTVIIFVVCLSLYRYGTPASDPVKSAAPQRMSSILQGNSTTDHALSTPSPAFGGIDIVDIFLSSKLTNGSYNENAVGHVGSDDFSCSYLNKSYSFISRGNLRAFEAEPSQYLPQWGGFDACMVASSACYDISPSDWPPLDNWQHWTIQDNRTFFFSTSECKNQFRMNMNDSIAMGDKCWNELHTNFESEPLHSGEHDDIRRTIRRHYLKGSR